MIQKLVLNQRPDWAIYNKRPTFDIIEEFGWEDLSTDHVLVGISKM